MFALYAKITFFKLMNGKYTVKKSSSQKSFMINHILSLTLNVYSLLKNITKNISYDK